MLFCFILFYFILRWWDLVEETVKIWTVKKVMSDRDLCDQIYTNRQMQNVFENH